MKSDAGSEEAALASFHKYSRERATGEGPGLIVLLAALMGLLSLSLDVYLPVLPEVARDLELTTPTDSRAMLTVFLFGFGLGHLLLAIVADSLPRKAVLLSALALYVAATLFCAAIASC